MASQPHTPKQFDPAVWLISWSDNGGIVFNTDERLFVGRSPFIDRAGTSALDQLRQELWRPGAAEALGDFLNRRARGELH